MCSSPRSPQPFRLAVCLLLGTAAVAAAQQGVSGVVRDPHDRAVAGARVALSCGTTARKGIAAEDGSFALPSPASAGACELTVEHPGFAVWRRQVRAGMRMAVSLEIATLADTVDVTSSQPPQWDAAAPLTAATLTAEDLQVLGPDSRRWLDTAMNTAGAFVGRRQIFVDGMPAGAAPDASLIAAISVNADPFSAEYGGVDSNRINVDLRRSDRRWRFSGRGPAWTRGGDALVRGSAPRSRSRSGALSGPLPRLPLTFFVQGGDYADIRRPTVFADGGLDVAPETVSRVRAWTAGVDLGLPRLDWRVMIEASRMRLTNAGMGGLTMPSAGFGMTTSSRKIQSTWRLQGTALRHRGGLSLTHEEVETTAISAERSVTVTNQLIAGGSEILASARSVTRLHARHVVERAGFPRPWSAGVEVSRDVIRDRRIVNPLGRIQLEAFGDSYGTWFVQDGAALADASASWVAAFAQRILLDGRRLSVRAGLRAEWQRDDGLLIAPRVRLVTSWRGWLIASNGGVFADAWSPGLLTEIAVRSSGTVVVQRVAAADPLAAAASAGEFLSLHVQPGFTRRRDIVANVSVRRRMGRVEAGVEHQWTRGMALSGLVRTRSAPGLIDLLDSDRRSSRRQLHARLMASLGRLSVTSHYEFVRSYDDTDGPFSLPARQADPTAEWGRATGIPAHHASAILSLAGPSGVRVDVVGTAASGSPYSIVTGRDPEGLATFVDRGGMARNTASAPGYRSVSLYAFRRFRLPGPGGIGLDAGVRVENLFDRLNPLDVGTVAGSGWVGRPISALAGRTVSVWISASR